ncbi:DUF4288 domain-containing protein [Nocardioides sp.]|uniref:DUF4288 domain-containing protein n=1 Tax=Nocardioides sp. TaxID=35761 RepID=UPI00262ADD31|nr:DUF4288 domain-containing protein [Nocardioides sp.]
MPDEDHAQPWFTVRSHVRCTGELGQNIYEERVVLFRATDADDAIRQAEREAAEYGETVGCEVLPLFQAFAVADEVGAGGELFSLMRESELDPDSYLDRFFDTGAERTS